MYVKKPTRSLLHPWRDLERLFPGQPSRMFIHPFYTFWVSVVFRTYLPPISIIIAPTWGYGITQVRHTLGNLGSAMWLPTRTYRCAHGGSVDSSRCLAIIFSY